MRFAEPMRSVIPGKSGLPSSRYAGNSGETMRGARTRCGAARDTNIVSRERQRIVQVVRASQASAPVQKLRGLACSQGPQFPSSSRRANDTRQTAGSRPFAFSLR